ncbi:MAG: hypothetical protein IT236_16250 [Bacteroidia bacterium]|nr:hypothetical protein [Bacteroidia bacterium]
MRINKNQIIFTGFIFHLFAAFFSVGYHQCDELFQVFEFAGYKLGLNQAQELPWEFAARMRSGIEPLWVYTISRLFYPLGITNPFQVALFLRIVQTLLSFFVTFKLIRFFEDDFENERSKLWLWAFGLLFWCLPYFHARLSSENFAGTLFMAALLVMLHNLKADKNKLGLVAAGFLFGIAFVCRFQMAFMFAGLLAWLLFIKKTPFKLFVLLLSGFIVAIVCGAVVDKWLYGEWTLSWLNYLYQNVFEDKASIYGRSPLYFYPVEAIVQLIPPFSIVLLFALFAFWKKFKTHFLTWVSIPFVLLHFFVAHKELRFLFPLLNFIPVMCLLYFQSVKFSQNKLFVFISSKGFVRFAIGCNALLLCYFAFKPADETSFMLKKIYDCVQGDQPVLYYQTSNPYNNNGGLNYFINKNITIINTVNDTLMHANYSNAYFFSEKFNEEKHIIKNGKHFEKIYANFPDWFTHINFNGWLNRASGFSIYRQVSE